MNFKINVDERTSSLISRTIESINSIKEEIAKTGGVGLNKIILQIDKILAASEQLKLSHEIIYPINQQEFFLSSTNFCKTFKEESDKVWANFDVTNITPLIKSLCSGLNTLVQEVNAINTEEKLILKVMNFKNYHHATDITKVLLIGPTGAGKTSYAHCISKSPFSLTDKQGDYIRIVSESNNPEQIIRSGANSATFSYTSYAVTEDSSSGVSYTFYDTPGLFDTRSEYQEIFNAFYFSHFIKLDQNLKIVVALNYEELVTDRNQAFRHLSEVFKTVKIGDCIKNEDITFVITKVPRWNQFGKKTRGDIDDYLKKVLGDFQNNQKLDDEVAKVIDFLKNGIESIPFFYIPSGLKDKEEICDTKLLFAKLKEEKKSTCYELFKSPYTLLKLSAKQNIDAICNKKIKTILQHNAGQYVDGKLKEIQVYYDTAPKEVGIRASRLFNKLNKEFAELKKGEGELSKDTYSNEKLPIYAYYSFCEALKVYGDIEVDLDFNDIKEHAVSKIISFIESLPKSLWSSYTALNKLVQENVVVWGRATSNGVPKAISTYKEKVYFTIKEFHSMYNKLDTKYIAILAHKDVGSSLVENNTALSALKVIDIGGLIYGRMSNNDADSDFNYLTISTISVLDKINYLYQKLNSDVNNIANKYACEGAGHTEDVVSELRYIHFNQVHGRAVKNGVDKALYELKGLAIDAIDELIKQVDELENNIHITCNNMHEDL